MELSMMTADVLQNESSISETRVFRKLRVSITESCNLSCVYCDAQKRESIGGDKTDLSMLLNIVRKLHGQLNLKSVRITGGEPALNRNLPDFIYELKQTGIPEVNLTSNGIYLENLLPALSAVGLDRINISLDSLDDLIFSRITGQTGVERVTRAILKARDLGFAVKINSIILRDLNENQVIPLLEFGLQNRILIRFLELMKMGWAASIHAQNFYARDEILSRIRSRYDIEEVPRELSSTARYFRTGETLAFGLISNHSDPFCGDCDRLRLDHKGNLYGCLSNPGFFPMAAAREDDYSSILEKAIALKQKHAFKGSELNMRHIGG